MRYFLIEFSPCIVRDFPKIERIMRIPNKSFGRCDPQEYVQYGLRSMTHLTLQNANACMDMESGIFIKCRYQVWSPPFRALIRDFREHQDDAPIV